MLGKKKVRQESLFAPMRRETRVSRELQAVRKILDFEWFRDVCRDKFCDDNGRPSIAPEVLVAMMFLGYWNNITSDRALCEECEDRLSFREFIGIDDDDDVPVHSSLTHWRQRLGREAFQKFLEHTIELAKKNGLVPGRCRLFDATLVKAQADASGKATVWVDPVRDANDYLDALGEWQTPVETEPGSSGNKGGSAVKRCRSKKLESGRPMRLNANDVDARFVARRGKKPDFYHKVHFEFDLSSQLVMNSDVGHVHDAVKMVEFLSCEKEPCDTVGGDTGYFTIDSQVWLRDLRISSLISVRDNAVSRGAGFGLEAFVRIEEEDCYICPNGLKLTRQNLTSAGEKRYATPRNSCLGCEYAMQCFQNGKLCARRQIGISAQRSVVEEAKKKNKRCRYKRIKVKRSIICEGGIGTMKNYEGLGRARGIGEDSMAIQSAFAAGVHNIKKIVRCVERQANGAKNGVSSLLRVVFLGHVLSLPFYRPNYARIAA